MPRLSQTDQGLAGPVLAANVISTLEVNHKWNTLANSRNNSHTATDSLHYVEQPEAAARRLGDAELVRLGSQPMSEVLRAFSAGKEVPGSGSANALTAALAACLTASVAAKTFNSESLKYIHVKQTAADVQRKATDLAGQLQELFENDSAVFAPVIALRRETGRLSYKIRHDDAVRKEVAALKPAIEIPIRIAELSVRAGELAVEMLETGFAAARGEAYTALLQAIGAVDGSLYVARLNVRTIRQRANKLNDPLLEAPWIEMILRKIGEIRDAAKLLQARAAIADKALEAAVSPSPLGTEPVA